MKDSEIGKNLWEIIINEENKGSERICIQEDIELEDGTK